MFRTLDMSIPEIVFDPAEASRRVNDVVCGGTGMTVAGIGATDGRILVFLESGVAPGPYRFAPFDGLSAAELAGEAKFRYMAGFSTVGTFLAGTKRWGLFCRSYTGEERTEDGSHE